MPTILISKHILHSHCLNLLEGKISGIQQLISDARDSSNNDTKSSMGDKYETTREMMQIEINKLQLQLAEAKNQLLAIKVLDPNKKCEKVEPGSIIETDKITFYLAAAIGKVNVNGVEIMAVSPISPVGKAMQGKKINEQFAVNNSTFTIVEIH